jgi:hypothetical protein
MFDYLAKKKQRVQDFNHVFGTIEGKRVLAEIYKMCGMNAQIHAATPYDTAFNAGKHRVGQGIASILSHGEGELFSLTRVVQQNEEAVEHNY